MNLLPAPPKAKSSSLDSPKILTLPFFFSFFKIILGIFCVRRLKASVGLTPVQYLPIFIYKDLP